MSQLTFAKDPKSPQKGAKLVLFVAPARTWKSGWLDTVAEGAWVKALGDAARAADPGRDGASAELLTGGQASRRVVAAVLPDSVSRHNAPSRHEAIAAAVAKANVSGSEKAVVVLGLDDPAHLLPAANAVGRKLALFTRKGGQKAIKGSVAIAATDAAGAVIPADRWVKETVAAARWAACMVDTPPADLTTARFVREAKKLVKGLSHVKVTEIVGEKLLEKGLGGIHAVGRTAMVAPRLLVLDYNPPRAKRRFGLVGKGVIYDTGGLSLKSTAGMSSMKGDMGGGAAVVGAFRVLVANKCKDRVIAAVPLAENAIGPNSYRPDDIIVMHSKKTVEINNTDAEGRLLLGDGVSYLARTFKLDALFDAATLTGAQLVSSGLRHASIVSNRQPLEDAACRIGTESGDLVHPLLFAPEFYSMEFDSKVADLRNSVADRSNAQSSCAAQFVYTHIEDVDVPWLHIDLAGPAWRDGRGTGFGVALMSSLLRGVSKGDLAK